MLKEICTVSPKQQNKWYIIKKLTSEKTTLQSTSIFTLNPIATKFIDLGQNSNGISIPTKIS